MKPSLSRALTVVAAMTLVPAAAALPAAAGAQPPTVSLVSVSSGSTAVAGNHDSWSSRISADGRYVTFLSQASNLTPDGTFNFQIYLRDTVAGSTIPISHNGMAYGDRPSQNPSVARGGAFVAFTSASTNLASGSDGMTQAMLWSRATGRSIIISKSSSTPPVTGGVSTTSPTRVSADGTAVLFTSSAPLTGQPTGGVAQLFRYDIESGTLSMISIDPLAMPASGGSELVDQFDISGDGSTVVFATKSQLTSMPTKGASQIYVWREGAPNLEVISLTLDGSAGSKDSYQPTISQDGAVVAFTSDAPNMSEEAVSLAAQGYVRDIISGTTRYVSRPSDGAPAGVEEMVLSGDGHRVAMLVGSPNFGGPSDNLTPYAQVYLRDVSTGSTVRVSRKRSDSTAAVGKNSAISVTDDGRRVAFTSVAPDIVPIPTTHSQVYLAEADTPPALERIDGVDRYAVSANTSASFVSPVELALKTTFMASGETYPDALAAAAAAGLGKGAVLLIRKDTVPEAIKDELRRSKPLDIVLVGGTNTISSQVEDELRAFARGTVKRQAGTDRYSGSAALSASQFPVNPAVAYIASGETFPDALAGAAAAGHEQGPVLLVKKNEVTTEVMAELARLKPRRVVVLGGTNTISDTVVAELSARYAVTRVAAADRYGTSAQLSRTAYPAGANTVVITSGEVFPDALSGGAAAIAYGAPVLLVMKDGVPASVSTELERLKPKRLIVLGGVNTISASTFESLRPFVE